MRKRGTKEYAEWFYKQPMNACPACGSWDFRAQTPVDLDLSEEDLKDPRKALGKWARAKKEGHTPLRGPVFFMCFNCDHKGPAVNCSGRTAEDVGQDPAVFTEMKRLWNEQERSGGDE